MIKDIESAVLTTQRRILEPLTISERAAFVRMLQQLVHINNEHSRAPLQINERVRRRLVSSQTKRAGAAGDANVSIGHKKG